MKPPYMFGTLARLGQSEGRGGLYCIPRAPLYRSSPSGHYFPKTCCKFNDFGHSAEPSSLVRLLRRLAGYERV